MLDRAFRSLLVSAITFLFSFSAFAEAPPTPNSATAPGPSTSGIAFAPDGTVSSFIAEEGGQNLVIKEKPGRGFYLVTLDSGRVQAQGFTVETRLDKVEQTSNTLVVSKGGNLPRFTFDISRGQHYLALKLKRVEGVPAKSLTSLHFEMLCNAGLLSLKINPMIGVEIRGGDVPWLGGQEFGPTGPRQFIRPGDEPLLIENPYTTQPARFSIHVLPELVAGVDAKAAQASKTQEAAALESYRIGADAKGQQPDAQKPQGRETGADLQPKAVEIQNQRFAQFQQEGNALIVSAENTKAEEVWIEEGLPSWGRTFSMAKGRGISMDVTGDGSGAVFVLQALGAGVRDYVVKINFTGKRSFVIPNGEVSWADGYWGWRFGAKHFDYGNVGALALGFGYIPAKTSPRVKMENLQLLRDQPSKLLNPVITTGAGTLTIEGEISTSQYIQYDGGDKATIYDENWNQVKDMKVNLKNYTMPTGFAPVSVKVADGAPRPWLEVQFITQDEPMRVRK